MNTLTAFALILLPFAPQQTSGLSPAEERWERVQFRGFGDIVAVKILEREGKREAVAEVTDFLQGFMAPRRFHIVEAAADFVPGSRWIVRMPDSGDYPSAVPARVKDTGEARRRILASVASPWRWSRFVFLVHVEKTPNQRIDFEVVRVLYGTLPEKRVWTPLPPGDLVRPLAVATQLYLACADHIEEEGPSKGSVRVQTLLDVDHAQVKSIEEDLKTQHQKLTLAKQYGEWERDHAVQTAWDFHQAPFIARVKSTRRGDDRSYDHYAPVEWLRGRVEDGQLAEGGGLIRDPEQHFALKSPITPPYRYLFDGGGRFGFETDPVETEYVGAGYRIGNHPAAQLSLKDPRCAQLVRWLQAPLPSFACRPVDPAVFDPALTPSAPPQRPSTDAATFNPSLDPEAFAFESLQGWMRFKVLRRREQGRWSWVHCAMLDDQAPNRTEGREWMLAGDELDDLTEGSEWWAPYLAADAPWEPQQKVWFPGKLFVGSLRMPATGRQDWELSRCFYQLCRRTYVQQRKEK